MDWAGVSLVVVDALFIAAPVMCKGSLFGPCFMQYTVSFLVLQSFWWKRERERAGFFILIVFLVPCDC